MQYESMCLCVNAGWHTKSRRVGSSPQRESRLVAKQPSAGAEGVGAGSSGAEPSRLITK